MKELLAFTFAILFISCQNIAPKIMTTASMTDAATTPDAIAAPADSPTCETLTDESWDLTRQLEDKVQPGIHYRAVTMTSEADSEIGFDSFVCDSQVTSSDDATDAATPSIAPTTASNDWEVLTQKWEYKPALATCIDPNTQAQGPACEAFAEPILAAN